MSTAAKKLQRKPAGSPSERSPSPSPSSQRPIPPALPYAPPPTRASSPVAREPAGGAAFAVTKRDKQQQAGGAVNESSQSLTEEGQVVESSSDEGGAVVRSRAPTSGSPRVSAPPPAMPGSDPQSATRVLDDPSGGAGEDDDLAALLDRIFAMPPDGDLSFLLDVGRTSAKRRREDAQDAPDAAHVLDAPHTEEPPAKRARTLDRDADEAVPTETDRTGETAAGAPANPAWAGTISQRTVELSGRLVELTSTPHMHVEPTTLEQALSLLEEVQSRREEQTTRLAAIEFILDFERSLPAPEGTVPDESALPSPERATEELLDLGPVEAADQDLFL